MSATMHAAPPPIDVAEHRGRRVAIRTILFIVLAIGSLAMLLPFIWMILTSLKSPAELASNNPTFLPQEWMWSNYPDAMQAAPFLTYFRNSFIIAFTHAAITVVVGSMAGYALARLPFRGRELIFMLFLAMLLIPTYTKIVPQFLMVKFMPLFGGNDIFGQGGSGWLNTWWALIIPGAVTASSVFLFRQFYLALPPELEEAARLDGVGEFGIYWRIYTPLMKPALATVGLLTFQEGWNNFLWPLLVTTKDNLRVIQVGLSVFQQITPVSWAFLMAGTTLATVPMVLLFLFAQRYFVQGFTHAGIK